MVFMQLVEYVQEQLEKNTDFHFFLSLDIVYFAAVTI